MAAKIACLDTNILSWLFKTSRDENKEKQERSDILVKNLEKDRYEICIPTIVLAETLYCVPEEKVYDLQKEIVTTFKVYPFDDLAAYYFRGIAIKNRNPAVDNVRWNRYADAKILATALSCGASCIYSEDKRLTALSDGTITVLPLPPLPLRQGVLPIPVVTELQQ